MQELIAAWPPAWQALAGVLALGIFLLAAAGAPWRRLADPHLQHAFLGGCVALMVLWSIRATVLPGLGFHFLGMTAFTLMFGWRLACIVTVPVVAAGVLTGAVAPASLGADALVLGMLPALLTATWHGAVHRWLPRHFFVFVFVSCYAAAALSMAAVIGGTGALSAVAGQALPGNWRELWPFVPLLVLAEAFLNGFVMAGLVAMRPEWVWSFDDAEYLAR